MFQISSGLLLLLLFLPRETTSFASPIRIEAFGASSSNKSSLKEKLGSFIESSDAVEDLKFQIENEIKSTKRGLSASPEQRTKIDSLVQSLESLCPYEEPARMPEMAGKWIVDYTTAPPPSNGKLGPFEGIARQIIDLDDGTYVNYLSVPGDIEKEFLSAKLEATFEEWDGELLKDDRISDDTEKKSDKSGNSSSQLQEQQSQEATTDYGANSWKVDFKTLTIKLFGFKVLEQRFNEGTSRVWKMSYLDKDGTRVVRAGRTGKDDDAMLFYMQKE